MKTRKKERKKARKQERKNGEGEIEAHQQENENAECVNNRDKRGGRGELMSSMGRKQKRYYNYTSTSKNQNLNEASSSNTIIPRSRDFELKFILIKTHIVMGHLPPKFFGNEIFKRRRKNIGTDKVDCREAFEHTKVFK